MGVPYAIVISAYLVAAFGLLLGWSMAGAVNRRRILGIAIVLVAGPVVLSVLGAPLRPDQQPLALGDQWGGDDPALLQIIDVGDGRSQFTYAFRPGAQIRMGIALANNGDVPLTVTGIGPPQFPIYVRDYKLLLPPGGPTRDLPALYPGLDPTWTSEPFHPFEIPAHSEAGVGLAVDLTACPDLKPVPTLAPGASFIPNDDSFTYVSGFGAADVVQINYAALGISRTTSLELQAYMNVATANAASDAPPNCSAP
jgi:hypothetical protein